MISFLTLSAPGAAETVPGMANRSWQDVRFRFLSSQLAIDGPDWLASLFYSRSEAAEAEIISHIRIYPGSLTLQRGEEAVFAAIAFDADNEPLSGVDFRWTAVHISSGRRAHFLNSVFEANRLGAFTVKARAGGREAAVRVLVVPQTGVRPVGTLTRLTSSRTGLGPVVASTDTPPVTTQPVKGGAANGQAKGEEVQINNLLPGDGWNDGNWMSAAILETRRVILRAGLPMTGPATATFR